MPDEERRIFLLRANGSNESTQNVMRGKRVSRLRVEQCTGPESFGRCNEGARALADQDTDGRIILGLIINK